jgi:ribosomal-protein-alanine N-acetyltransferase
VTRVFSKQSVGRRARDAPGASIDIGARILLRDIDDADAAVIAAASSDPAVVKWTAMPIAMSIDEAAAWVRRVRDRRDAGELRPFAIETELLPFAGYMALAHDDARNRVAEIFYWLMPDARRRGVARAALSELTARAFSVWEVERLEILIDPRNRRSRKLARACGYVYEGTLRRKRIVHGNRRDLAMYARLASDV